MALPRDVVTLSDDQFNKLVELLTPGYELAKAYLEQSKPEPAPPDAIVDGPGPVNSEASDDKKDEAQ